LDTGSTLCKVASATSIWSFVRIDKHRWRLSPSRYPTTTPISEAQESFCIAIGFAKRPPLLARRIGRRTGNVTQPTSAFDVAVGSNSEILAPSTLSPLCSPKADTQRVGLDVQAVSAYPKIALPISGTRRPVRPIHVPVPRAYLSRRSGSAPLSISLSIHPSPASDGSETGSNPNRL
jgi:hypothetical protein